MEREWAEANSIGFAPMIQTQLFKHDILLQCLEDHEHELRATQLVTKTFMPPPALNQSRSW